MTLNDWRLVFEGAVAVVAVLAFLLSLANLYYTWWSSQPRVRVTMTAAVPLIGGTFRDPLFLITAANVGRVPVTLTSVGMDLAAKGETAVFLRPPLYAPPLKHTLEPGRAWEYHADPADVIEWHVGPKGPVRAVFVNDETGHHWRGRVKRSWLDARAK